MSSVLSNTETYTDSEWSKSAFAQMEDIRRMGKLCDITLVANDHKFTAHRIVLASNIPYFHAMFLHDMIESKQDIITINNIDHNALEQIINYSYSGSLMITHDNVQTLLQAANFFNLKNIKNACTQFIKQRINLSNVLEIKKFAEQFMLRDLQKAISLYINKNFLKICSINEYLNLGYCDILDLISKDELNVESEEKVYDAVIKWIKHDEETRAVHLHDLLKHIRLTLLPTQFLVDILYKEPLIQNNSKYRSLLDEAIFYHLLPERRVEYGKQFNLKPRCCDDSHGLVYAIGGLNSNGNSVSTVEVYDCLNDKWSLAESMSTNRSRVAVTVLQGKLYAIGGYSAERLATVEVYEPELKKWRRVSPISKPRSALGSAALNNKLYVCGGYNGSKSLDTVEAYDPKSDTWTMVSNMKKHRSAAGVAAFIGMIYVAGGHDGYRIFESVECYNTQTDVWSLVSPMNNKRCRLGLSALNGLLYAAGGYDSIAFLQTVECYCPKEDKWKYVAPMNVKRSRMGLVTCNSKLYAIGGYDGVCNLSSVEYYDPENDQWTMVSSMIAHEGVVGVGVLPIDITASTTSTQQCDESSRYETDTLTTATTANNQILKRESILNSQNLNVNPSGVGSSAANEILNNNHFMNYYSLIEDEDDQNDNNIRRNSGNLLQMRIQQPGQQQQQQQQRRLSNNQA